MQLTKFHYEQRPFNQILRRLLLTKDIYLVENFFLKELYKANGFIQDFAKNYQVTIELVKSRIYKIPKFTSEFAYFSKYLKIKMYSLNIKEVNTMHDLTKLMKENPDALRLKIIDSFYQAKGKRSVMQNILGISHASLFKLIRDLGLKTEMELLALKAQKEGWYYNDYFKNIGVLPGRPLIL